MVPESREPGPPEASAPDTEEQLPGAPRVDGGTGQEPAVDGKPDDGIVPLDPLPADEQGEPSSGFVASDPQPSAPEQAMDAEPFAEVADVDVAGAKVDPFAELSEKDHKKHEASLKSIRDAQRSGQELAMSPRRRRVLRPRRARA
jgi:hypothetical protein